ncbi:hypothetical protein FRB97_007122 [Tulasnella sp. 331]|nr:hypothetical protein FRB97_007122 [Tulasnella sp. 331]
MPTDSTLSAEGAKVDLVMLGMYVWEVFSSGWFDLEVLQGKRQFKWPMLVYWWSKYFTFWFIVAINIMLQVTKPVNCMAMSTFIDFSGRTAIAAASNLLLMRSLALWHFDPRVLYPMIILSIGQWVILLHNMFITTEAWSYTEQTCVVETVRHDWTKVQFIYMTIIAFFPGINPIVMYMVSDPVTIIAATAANRSFVRVLTYQENIIALPTSAIVTNGLPPAPWAVKKYYEGSRPKTEIILGDDASQVKMEMSTKVSSPPESATATERVSTKYPLSNDVDVESQLSEKNFHQLSKPSDSDLQNTLHVDNPLLYGAAFGVALLLLRDQNVKAKTAQDVSERIQRLETDLTEARETGEKLCKELTGLQSSLQQATATKASVDEKLAKAHKLSEKTYQDLVVEDNKHAETRRQLEAKEAELNQARAEVAMAGGEQDGWKIKSSKVERLEKKLADAQRSIEQATREKDDLTKKFSQNEAKHAQSIKQADQDASSSKSALAQTKERMRVLEAEKVASAKELFTASSTVAELKQKISQVEAQLTSSDSKTKKLAEQLAASRAEYDVLLQQSRAEAEAATRDLAALKDEHQALSSKVEQSAAAHAEVESARVRLLAEAEQAEMSAKDAAAKVGVFDFRNGKLAAAHQELSTASGKVTDLESLRASLDEKVIAAEESIKASVNLIAALEKEVSDSRTSAASLSQEKIAAEATIVALTATIAKIESRISSVEGDKMCADAEVAKRDAEVEALKQRASGLLFNLLITLITISEVQSKLNSADSGTKELVEQVTSLKAQHAALLEKTATENEAASRELSVLKKQHQTLGARAERSAAAHAESEAAHAHLLTQAEEAETRAKDAAAKLAAAHEELSTTSSKVIDLETLKASMDEKVQAAEASIKALLDQISALENEISESKSSAASLASEKLAAEASITALSATVAELEARILTVENEKREVDSMIVEREAEIKALKETISAVQVQISSLECRAQGLSDELTSTKSEHALVLEKSRAESEAVRHDLSALKEQHQSLTDQAEKSMIAHAESESARSHLLAQAEQAESSAKEAAAKLAAVHQDLETSSCKVTDLEGLKALLDDKVKAAEESVQDSLHQISALEKQILQSKSETASLTSEKLAAEASIAALTATVVELEGRISSVASEKNDVDAIVVGCEAKIKILQEKVNAAEAEVTKHESHATELESHLAMLLKTTQESKESAISKQAELDALTTETQALKGHITTAESNHIAVMGNLNSKIEEHATTLKALQAEKDGFAEKLKEAEAKAEEVDAELALVKNDLEKARVDAAEAASAKFEHSQRADVAEAKLSHTSETVASLEKSLSELRLASDSHASEKDALGKQVADLSQKSSDWEAKHSQVSSEKEVIATQLAEKHDHVDAANNKVTTLEAELNDMKEKLSKSGSDHAAAQEEIAALRAALERTQSEKAAINASSSEKELAINALETQVSELKTATSKVEETSEANAAAKAELEKQLDVAHAKIAEVESTVTSIHSALNAAKAHGADIDAQKAEVTKALEDANAASETLSAKVAQLEESLHHSEAKHSELDGEKKRLNKEVDDHSTARADLEAKLSEAEAKALTLETAETESAKKLEEAESSSAASLAKMSEKDDAVKTLEQVNALLKEQLKLADEKTSAVNNELAIHQETLSSTQDALSKVQATTSRFEEELKTSRQRAEDAEAKATTYQSNIADLQKQLDELQSRPANETQHVLEPNAAVPTATKEPEDERQEPAQPEAVPGPGPEPVSAAA